jgi:hypothetical protein
MKLILFDGLRFVEGYEVQTEEKDKRNIHSEFSKHPSIETEAVHYLFLAKKKILRRDKKPRNVFLVESNLDPYFRAFQSVPANNNK